MDSTRFILLADTNVQFIEKIKSDPKVSAHPLKVAQKGHDAQAILSDKSIRLAGVFISPTIADPDWISIVRCAHMHRPNLPIYVMNEDGQEFKEMNYIDFEKLGIKERIQRPMNYEEIVKLVAPLLVTFNPKEALAKADSKEDENLSQDDEEFISIRSEDFLAGTKSFFDVFIRMTSGRYLKLLQAGDEFTPDRLENYLNKGLKYFYIKKNVQEVYLQYCDHLTSALLKSKAAPVELKASQTLNQGEEALKHLKLNGLTEAAVKYGEQFIKNVNLLSSQLTNEQTDLVQGFLSNTANYDHGVGTAMLAGILARAMHVETEKPAQIIGMAALFHDLGLVGMPDKFIEEDESKMTPEEIDLYRTHPAVGAEKLRLMGGMDPAVIQAVSQHHMRMGNQGFPTRTGTTVVIQIAELIGICDELQKIITKSQKDASVNLFIELDTKVYPFFSKKIVKSFKEAFYPKQYVKEDGDAA